MNGTSASQANTYRITVRGVLKSPLADWLGDIQVMPQENDTILLVGQFADQPALRGLLDQLWNLNFSLMSVEMIERQSEQSPPQIKQESA